MKMCCYRCKLHFRTLLCISMNWTVYELSFALCYGKKWLESRNKKNRKEEENKEEENKEEEKIKQQKCCH